MKLLTASMLLAFGLVAYRTQPAGAFSPNGPGITWPRPHRFAGVAVAYSVLGLLATAGAPQLAGAFGLGVNLALAFAKLPGSGTPSAGSGSPQAPGAGASSAPRVPRRPPGPVAL
ncbi:MAG: hypothetical protein ACYDAY_12005 [Candidatus Dormibacteria bacterium]